jgi:flagellar protein FlbT
MSGLVLKLAPKERILINGAVVENGDRRSRVTVLTPNANILRLKDAIHPEAANTPVRYACYLSQLLLSGDLDSAVVKSRLHVQIMSLKHVFLDTESSTLLKDADAALDANCLYVCLKNLRQLLPLEAKLLRYSQ